MAKLIPKQKLSQETVLLDTKIRLKDMQMVLNKVLVSQHISKTETEFLLKRVNECLEAFK